MDFGRYFSFTNGAFCHNDFEIIFSYLVQISLNIFNLISLKTADEVMVASVPTTD